MELVDVLDSKSSAARRAGSSPATGTRKGSPKGLPFLVLTAFAKGKGRPRREAPGPY